MTSTTPTDQIQTRVLVVTKFYETNFPECYTNRHLSQIAVNYYDTNVRLIGNGNGHWKNWAKKFRNQGNQIYDM